MHGADIMAGTAQAAQTFMGLAAANDTAMKIKNLVIFGDSYTDTEYVWTGGSPWVWYAAMYGKPEIEQVHSFARSGAACSKKLTPRVEIPAPFIMEDEVPAYMASNLSTTLDMRETLFTIWTGTNDVGIGNLLTGNDIPGVNIVDVTKCVVDWVQTMHDLGARNFLVMNMVPLQHSPFYGPESKPWIFWRKEHDGPSWARFMENVVPASNVLVEFMLKELVRETSDLNVGILDTYALYSDIIANPSEYLNGTLPLNTSGGANLCPYEIDSVNPETGESVLGGPVGGVCPTPITKAEERDSYLWFDELHPGEQAGRLVAREVVRSVQEGSKWARWLS